jgi:hypothetical protein
MKSWMAGAGTRQALEVLRCPWGIECGWCMVVRHTPGASSVDLLSGAHDGKPTSQWLRQQDISLRARRGQLRTG